MPRRLTTYRSETHAENRAKNNATRLRILSWMGKDKGVPEFAEFMGVSRNAVSALMATLAEGSNGRHKLCDHINEKLGQP